MTTPTSATVDGKTIGIGSVPTARSMNGTSTSTMRARRCRERKKQGRRIVSFELLREEVDAFVMAGFICEAERSDPERLGFAMEKILLEWMARRRV